MAYATTYKNNIQALILSNTAPDARYREELGWNVRKRYSKTVVRALNEYFGKTDDKSVRARYTQSLSVYFKPTNHEAAKLLMDGAARIASEEYVHLAKDELSKFTYREKLREISHPVMIIASTLDVWPESAVKLMINDMEHAAVIYLKAGHFGMLEGARIYWNTVFDWVSETHD